MAWKSALAIPLVIALFVLFSFKLMTDPDLFHTLLSIISGINVNQISSPSGDSLRNIQPDMVRLDGFPWDIVESAKGVFDYTLPDMVMKWSRANKLQVLGIIQYAPGWANGQYFRTPPNLGIQNCGIPNLGTTTAEFNTLRTYPPKNAVDFGNYAYAIAKRYKDVMYWQVWNEPNNPVFWPTGPDAQEYTNMLKATYARIKKANPHAQIVLGGISLNDLDYINALYAAGAKDYFDILAVHLYNPGQAPSAYLDRELEKLQAAMAARGDGAKSIWLTEIGWYTGTAPHSVSEDQQGRYLEQVYAIANSKSYVGAVFWNALTDCNASYDASNPEHNYGIYFSDFKPKKAAAVMRGMMLNNKAK